MNIFLSLLPILSPIVALLFKVRALYASLWGVMTAIIAILCAFPLSIETLQRVTLHWLPLILEVMSIIAGGLFLSHVLQRGQAQSSLAQWIESRAGHGIGAILLIVHGITPFAESVTGFGIGIAVGVPLLAHLRLPAKKIAVIGLLGLCAVPWGSMGPRTLIAATMANISFNKLGVVSGVISVIPFTITGMIAAWLGSPHEHRARNIFYGFLSGIILTCAITLINIIFGTAPAGALGSLIVIIGHLLWRKHPHVSPLNTAGRNALYSYGILLGGILLTEWMVRLFGLPKPWHYLASPALWLFIAALFFTKGRPTRSSVKQTSKAWLNTAPVTGLFILLGILMSSSGMATYLAMTLAPLGRSYAIIAPFMTAIGGFITGSNSGANAMLATTQAGIARSLGLNILWFMGIQNVTSAFLLMASPGKIEMACQLTPHITPGEKLWLQSAMICTSFIIILFITLVSFLLIM